MRAIISGLSVLAAIPALLLSHSAHASWSITLDAPSGDGICPAILEPFTYQADTCQFVAQRIIGASTKQSMWEDALVQATVKSGSGSCGQVLNHYLWIDGGIYPLPAGSIIQHQRAAISAFALNLSNCQRAGGSAAVTGGTPQLLLANTELATTGNAFWFFDEPARSAYLRVTTVTGDVRCAGAQATPIVGDLVFRDGIEAQSP